MQAQPLRDAAFTHLIYSCATTRLTCRDSHTVQRALRNVYTQLAFIRAFLWNAPCLLAFAGLFAESSPLSFHGILTTLSTHFTVVGL